MNKFSINGGKKLNGSVKVQGAKNSVLPILAASILTTDKVVINDCPEITDVDNMLKILKNLGCDVIKSKNRVEITGGITCYEVPKELASELRSSIFLLGSILSVLHNAKIAYPGGCDIGIRPIDIHLKGLRELNVDINEGFGYISCNAENMKCGDILLDLPSVGATENLIMASVFLKGKTILRNVAKEPEIVDLINFLNKMGAKIKGAGTAIIEITGVDTLHGVEHTPIPDRIVAGTLIIAGAMCGGELELTNINSEHIFSLVTKLMKTSCKIACQYDKIYINSSNKLASLDVVETSPYPGFPTDLQAQIMACQLISQGTSVIVENMFETRFKQVPEFNKLGADITVRGRMAVVKGVKELRGAEVDAFDLRGGAGLVLAGLVAKGNTIVSNVSHIDRGYEQFENVLQGLGADIVRI